MKIIVLISLVFLFTSGTTWGQKSVLISIIPVFGKNPIVVQPNSYKLPGGDSIQFETIKFYISAIELLQNQKLVWKEPNSFYLFDLKKLESGNIELKTDNDIVYNQIRFAIGIDSSTNISGALGGDLDPTKGMYWAWDNGYINARIEGKSNLCKTRNNEFQFHIGGYRKNVNTARTVILPVYSNGNKNNA